METLWVDEKSNWDNRAYYQTTFSQRLSWCCTHLYRWKMAEIAGFKSGEGCQDCLTSGWRILTFRGNMVSLVACRHRDLVVRPCWRSRTGLGFHFTPCRQSRPHKSTPRVSVVLSPAHRISTTLFLIWREWHTDVTDTLLFVPTLSPHQVMFLLSDLISAQ